MRVGGGNRRAGGSGDLHGDAVGEAHGAPLPVVVAGAKQPGAHRERRVERGGVEHTELSQVEDGVLIGGSPDSHQVVEHFRKAERGERGVAVVS